MKMFDYPFDATSHVRQRCPLDAMKLGFQQQQHQPETKTSPRDTVFPTRVSIETAPDAYTATLTSSPTYTIHDARATLHGGRLQFEGLLSPKLSHKATCGKYIARQRVRLYDRFSRCVQVLPVGTTFLADPVQDAFVRPLDAPDLFVPAEGLTLLSPLPQELKHFTRSMDLAADADLSKVRVTSPPNASRDGHRCELVVRVPRQGGATQKALPPPVKWKTDSVGEEDLKAEDQPTEEEASNTSLAVEKQQAPETPEELETVGAPAEPETPQEQELEMPAAQRRLSQSSSEAMEKLTKAAEELERMERVSKKAEEEVRVAPTKGVPPGLRNQLAQLIGWASRLLENNLDAIGTSELESGRHEAKRQKRVLTLQTDQLITRLQSLIERLDALKTSRTSQAQVNLGEADNDGGAGGEEPFSML